MKDEHTYFEKMARIGHNNVIYKGTFVLNQFLAPNEGFTQTYFKCLVQNWGRQPAEA